MSKPQCVTVVCPECQESNKVNLGDKMTTSGVYVCEHCFRTYAVITEPKVSLIVEVYKLVPFYDIEQYPTN